MTDPWAGFGADPWTGKAVGRDGRGLENETTQHVRRYGLKDQERGRQNERRNKLLPQFLKV